MKSKLNTVILPNQKQVFCLGKDEAKILYRQIKDYFQSGITINQGDTVFDVGANIGLFSLEVNQICQGNVNIYAFEPIPSIFAALESNAAQFNSAQTKVFPLGVGQQAQTIEFEYYPDASAISTMYPDRSGQEQEKMALSLLNSSAELPFPVNLIRFLPRFFASWLINKLVDFIYSPQIVAAQIKSLSQIIAEESITVIDILKIDVEKAELDVLEGIEPQDWSKIKQVIMEVHNIDNRLERIRELLAQQGFNQIEHHQDPKLEIFNVYSIYAVK